MNRRKGQFSVEKVGSECLSGFGVGSCQVEDIVENLKRHAQQTAEPGEKTDRRVRLAGKRGAEPARGLQEGGCFPLDDPVVFGPGHIEPPLACDLEKFPFTGTPACSNIETLKR